MIFEFILMVAISNLILAGVLAFNRHVKEINSWVMRALMILLIEKRKKTPAFMRVMNCAHTHINLWYNWGGV